MKQGRRRAVYEAPVFEANEKRDEHDPFVTIRGFFVLKKQASEQEKYRIIPGQSHDK